MARTTRMRLTTCMPFDSRFDGVLCLMQSLVHVLAAMAPCTRLYGYLGCQLARTQGSAGGQPYSHDRKHHDATISQQAACKPGLSARSCTQLAMRAAMGNFFTEADPP